MLLASGAPIGVMNVIRNELSAIKGGRLAAIAAPARVATLIVSDIPGDEPALVASGPTVPLKSSRAEARHLASLYRLKLPAPAGALLASDENLPPQPSDPRFAANSVPHHRFGCDLARSRCRRGTALRALRRTFSRTRSRVRRAMSPACSPRWPAK